MTDITKCDNESCPLRTTCWRWLAPVGYMQAFHTFQPDTDGICDEYYDVGRITAERIIEFLASRIGKVPDNSRTGSHWRDAGDA